MFDFSRLDFCSFYVVCGLFEEYNSLLEMSFVNYIYIYIFLLKDLIPYFVCVSINILNLCRTLWEFSIFLVSDYTFLYPSGSNELGEEDNIFNIIFSFVVCCEKLRE